MGLAAESIMPSRYFYFLFTGPSQLLSDTCSKWRTRSCITSTVSDSIQLHSGLYLARHEYSGQLGARHGYALPFLGTDMKIYCKDTRVQNLSSYQLS